MCCSNRWLPRLDSWGVSAAGQRERQEISSGTRNGNVLWGLVFIAASGVSSVYCSGRPTDAHLRPRTGAGERPRTCCGEASPGSPTEPQQRGVNNVTVSSTSKRVCRGLSPRLTAQPDQRARQVFPPFSLFIQTGFPPFRCGQVFILPTCVVPCTPSPAARLRLYRFYRGGAQPAEGAPGRPLWVWPRAGSAAGRPALPHLDAPAPPLKESCGRARKPSSWAPGSRRVGPASERSTCSKQRGSAGVGPPSPEARCRLMGPGAREAWGSLEPPDRWAAGWEPRARCQVFGVPSAEPGRGRASHPIPACVRMRARCRGNGGDGREVRLLRTLSWRLGGVLADPRPH
ncbi:uncharacterized protein LOC123833492 [Phyllostomus hastatus]|uniref:uncharacterized protein LOC123833492 n=1 Tax=Phyllostomus hastatus TaxID=9423 RepID=UPI001E682BFD|nr:uncharacterized protein LOC123833492 [Phyllostomus hastatus]